MLGVRSKREITRTRIRVRTAMAAQTREQGRYLGGRPPYGYRLADAGPHPNRAHAAWGRRARRLEPDPLTAPNVTWIFAQRRAGHSIARITRALNDAGIPCPSAADPERNAHRGAQAWTLTTVRALLANPRYTGRQVWNRQPTALDLIDPANAGLGHRQVQRWGLPDGWVISARPAHPALVSEQDFIAVQGIRAARENTGTERRYRLAGLLRCGICKRRLESFWANNRAAYRCRHGYSSANTPDPARPKNLYIREDHILPHLPALHILLAQAETAAGEPTSGGRSPQKTWSATCAIRRCPGRGRARPALHARTRRARRSCCPAGIGVVPGGVAVDLAIRANVVIAGPALPRAGAGGGAGGEVLAVQRLQREVVVALHLDGVAAFGEHGPVPHGPEHDLLHDDWYLADCSTGRGRIGDGVSAR